MLHKNIDRIEASQDIRTLNIAMSAASGEQVKDLYGKLVERLGKIAVYDVGKVAVATAVRDPNAGDILKGLSKAK